jgi:hypothetical protein
MPASPGPPCVGAIAFLLIVLMIVGLAVFAVLILLAH